MPYLQDADFTLYNGDALEVLRELPSESVQMCVTSPPFFGLRNYDCEGQIGLESTPEEWCAKLVEVFREVRRVLRKDGTLWLECGDSYAGGVGQHNGWDGNNKNPDGSPRTSRYKGQRIGSKGHGCKPKDLIGAPWLLAFALRADGWYLRSEIIWSKPNPMPESVNDRPTKAHSTVFLLSKSARYFYDAESIREGWADARMGHAYPNGVPEGAKFKINPDRNDGGIPPDARRTLDGSDGEAPRGPDGRRATAVKAGDNSIQHRDGERWPNSGRNARSVWQIPTEPLPFEHYAAFPQALVERCIKAGTSERGCCPECGAGWVREVERERAYDHTTSLPGKSKDGPYAAQTGNGAGTHDVRHGVMVRTSTLGWRPSCEHGHAPVPCVVMDCFGGSGTTALVARRLGRHSLLIELSPKYCELAAKRTHQLSLLGEDPSATRETVASD